MISDVCICLEYLLRKAGMIIRLQDGLVSDVCITFMTYPQTIFLYKRRQKRTSLRVATSSLLSTPSNPRVVRPPSDCAIRCVRTPCPCVSACARLPAAWVALLPNPHRVPLVLLPHLCHQRSLPPYLSASPRSPLLILCLLPSSVFFASVAPVLGDGSPMAYACFVCCFFCKDEGSFFVHLCGFYFHQGLCPHASLVLGDEGGFSVIQPSANGW